MTSFHLFDSTGESDGSLWPLEDAAGGSLPNISAWRQWGHSWTGGQPDAPAGETGFSERLAGVLGVDGAWFENYGIFGSSLIQGFSGWGYYLHATTKASDYNRWPWEPYHGIDAFMWGLNDFGIRSVTGMITGGPDPWPTQRDMWRAVWRESWRTVIQRSLAGGIFPGERNRILDPTQVNNPATPIGSHPSIVYGGPGGGGWSFVDTRESSGEGYWRTSTTGATVTITVPLDYDTGYIAVRHVVPGSYFPGAQTIYGADGTGPYGSGPAVPDAGKPAIIVGAAGSEVTLAPASITTATAGVAPVVRDPRILRWRQRYAPDTFEVGQHLSIVDRLAVPITPNTTRTVTITVGSVPAGGWYGFDSWEIEARQVARPPGPVVANVAPPAKWSALYLLGVNTWPAMNTTAQLASDDIAAVCAEYDDPGVCVADIRAALVGHELDYAVLYAAGVTPETGGGQGSNPIVGDGTHPHSIGARLLGQAYRDALIKADLPAHRYAVPFTPERGMARA